MTYGQAGHDLTGVPPSMKSVGMGRKSWWRELKCSGTFSGNLARKVEWVLLMIGVK